MFPINFFLCSFFSVFFKKSTPQLKILPFLRLKEVDWYRNLTSKKTTHGVLKAPTAYLQAYWFGEALKEMSDKHGEKIAETFITTGWRLPIDGSLDHKFLSTAITRQSQNKSEVWIWCKESDRSS